MSKKAASFIISTLVVSSIFTGCSQKPASPTNPTSQATPTSQASSKPEANNLLEQIKAAGKIRIGTEGTYAPYTFHDKDGKLTGFDVEIAEEVAKRLGVKADFVETKWDGMFAGLDAKRFDAVVNEISIRKDRQEKYDFSDPYIVAKAVLIVHKDNDTIKKVDDLKGKKAGQTLDSNFEAVAKANGANIVTVESFNQSIELLASKRIDATINDNLSYLDFKKQKPDAPIKVVGEVSDKESSAILFNKGNKELVDAVNKALGDIKQDGTYSKISQKWFGEDVSK